MSNSGEASIQADEANDEFPSIECEGLEAPEDQPPTKKPKSTQGLEGEGAERIAVNHAKAKAEAESRKARSKDQYHIDKLLLARHVQSNQD